MFFRVEVYNAESVELIDSKNSNLLSTNDTLSIEVAREIAVTLLKPHTPEDATIRTTGEQDGIFYIHIYQSDGSGPLTIFARVEKRLGVRPRKRATFGTV